MKLQVTQCQVGQFNWLGNEKSLSFYMQIQDDNDKVIEENGIKARLYYSGDPDEYDIFKEAYNYENLGEIFEKCFKYCNRIISSYDHKSECLLFIKTYQENLGKLNEYHLQKYKEKCNKEIERLKKELDKNYIIEDLSWYANNEINREIKKYNQWIESYEKENIQLKEDYEKYLKNLQKIEKYKQQIDKLEKSKVLEYEY